MSPLLLTVKEVAELLGKSTKWVYQHQRDIPGRMKVGRSILWHKEVLLDSLKRRATGPAPDWQPGIRRYDDRHKLLNR